MPEWVIGAQVAKAHWLLAASNGRVHEQVGNLLNFSLLFEGHLIATDFDFFSGILPLLFGGKVDGSTGALARLAGHIDVLFVPWLLHCVD